MACAFFIVGTPSASADPIPSGSEVSLLNQDYAQVGAIPGNIVMGNHQAVYTTTTLSYNTAAKAIDYRMAGTQTGSLYVGIEPVINGNLSISLKIISDGRYSNVYIEGSTFFLQTLTMPDGQARVASYYQTSATAESVKYYDVPAASMPNGVNTINIMISGTTKSLTVYFDDAHKITTPMYGWSVQKLPYEPITSPMIVFTNERSSSSSYVTTQLYSVKESVRGGLVSAIPGNDYVPFGIDYPRDYANLQGTDYMSSADQKGVAWADVGWLEWQPAQKAFIQSLLDDGWELGIHFNDRLNDLSTPNAQALMQSEYNEITSIFGRSPTSWCSYQNADSVTHAVYAYQQWGMIWRNGQTGVGFLPNVGNLQEGRWSQFWSKVSSAQIPYPSFTHDTDDTTPQDYAMTIGHFTEWIDNYDGKQIIGFYEYYYRMANQVDTHVSYLEYIAGEKLRFSVSCNEYDTRLVISFPSAGTAAVMKDGNVLVKDVDYSVVGDDRIILYTGTGAVFEITSHSTPGAPSAPRNVQAVSGNAQVALTWDAPSSNGGSPITNYKVYRGTTAGAETLLTTIGNVLTYTDLAVTNGQTYYYRVSAVNSIGEGVQSSEVSATPAVPASLPSAPQSLSATAGNAQVTLTWVAPSSNGGSPITNYAVYRGTSSGSEVLLATIGNVLTYTNTGLTNGVTYYYKVAAVNSVGAGPQSNEVSATPTAPLTAPSAPRSLTAAGGDAQIVLGWLAPSSNGGSPITNYKVYRGTTAGGEVLLTTIGNVLTYTDTTVTGGITYYYKVSAVNSIGESEKSNEASSSLATPADFTFQLINGGTAVEITGYTGSSSSVVIPSSINGKPVTSIGAYAFYGKSTMTSVVIPSGVTNIANDAFIYCTGLASVNIPGTVVNIGDESFYECSALRTLVINPGVVSIGQWAFYGCPLTSAVIPEGVTSVASFAFTSCTSLTSVTLPSTLRTMGDAVFAYCSALTSVTIPAGVTSIGSYMFYGCTGLTAVTIPAGVTSIGSYAFYNCAALTTVTIPSTVTSIGANAFIWCSSLIAMYFEGNAPTVGTDWIAHHNSNLIIYYHSGATGFTTPTWGGVTTRTY